MRIRSEKTINKINNGIANCEEFTAASIRGDHYWHPFRFGTWFSEEEFKNFASAFANNDKVFVVFSYGTPIAWKPEGGTWYVTDVKYSPSTTHHTNLVRNAISLAN